MATAKKPAGQAVGFIKEKPKNRKELLEIYKKAYVEFKKGGKK